MPPEHVLVVNLSQSDFMENESLIINKVAKSGLVTIDLESLAGDVEFCDIDIKNFLYMELMLREKDYRDQLEHFNWAAYQGKVVALHCSTDAIIAPWAYALMVTYLDGVAKSVFQTIPGELPHLYFKSVIDEHDWSQYAGKRVLLKGCSDKSIPASAYMYATEKLVKFAERIMYGEACSFVPVWRKTK